MKPIILYSSRGGNTRKVADAIASELNCPSVGISQGNLSSEVDLNIYDLIVVGTGIYFGQPNEELLCYLKGVNLAKSKKFAIFMTWGGAGQTYLEALKQLKNVLQEKEGKVFDDTFKCYGGRKFTFLRRGHPTEGDLIAARQWAKKLLSEFVSV